MGGNNKKKNKNRNKKKNRRNAERNQNDQPIEDKSDQFENEEEPQDEGEFNAPKASPKKRQHDDDDSDQEDKPRKKKKKKQPMAPDTTEKKGKKSIRQMKREKFAQRQAEAQAVAKDQLKSQCLNYLSQWKHDKQNWKFMKAKQVWLYKNKFSLSLLPDSSWPLLLEYFESAQGNIRKMLLDDAHKIIKQMDEWTESQIAEQHTEANDNEDENNEDGEEAPENNKPNENVYKRARDIIQCLEE